MPATFALEELLIIREGIPLLTIHIIRPSSTFHPLYSTLSLTSPDQNNKTWKLIIFWRLLVDSDIWVPGSYAYIDFRSHRWVAAGDDDEDWVK